VRFQRSIRAESMDRNDFLKRIMIENYLVVRRRQEQRQKREKSLQAPTESRITWQGRVIQRKKLNCGIQSQR
jgi:hypothetical protein